MTEEPIISAAKRNMKEMDIVPLFYDANKAPPEILTWETIFIGLKRAHDYSGIGQVSNAITKLWNKPNPNPDAAKLLTMYNNYVIDAAKTGFVNSYEDHPESKEIVNKAIGGKTGRMPWFFQFSKNGRRDLHEKISKRKTYLKANNSTMNRIWKRFSTIGNINMNLAEVRPFNHQMLLSAPPPAMDYEAINLFCEMDDLNLTNVIEASKEPDMDEREKMKAYDILAEDIANEFYERYGDDVAYKAYPSIVRYLFTDENLNKRKNKQMFWRVFGNIAFDNLQTNLQNCTVCPECGMRVPAWNPMHECAENMKGFVTCCDCGKVVPRTNSRQVRCSDCQAEHKRVLAFNRKRRQRGQVA